jgi:hypothetical protein
MPLTANVAEPPHIRHTGAPPHPTSPSCFATKRSSAQPSCIPWRALVPSGQRSSGLVKKQQHADRSASVLQSSLDAGRGGRCGDCRGADGWDRVGAAIRQRVRQVPHCTSTPAMLTADRSAVCGKYSAGPSGLRSPGSDLNASRALATARPQRHPSLAWANALGPETKRETKPRSSLVFRAISCRPGRDLQQPAARPAKQYKITPRSAVGQGLPGKHVNTTRAIASSFLCGPRP